MSRVGLIAGMVAALGAATMPSGASAKAGPKLAIGEGAAQVVLKRPTGRVATAIAGQATTLPSGQIREVVAWTESKRVRRGHWRWSTYLTWCAATSCAAPHVVGRITRTTRAGTSDPLTYWQLSLSTSADHAFVQWGPRYQSHWTVADVTGAISMRGTTPPWTYGGAASYLHTAARDLVGWADSDGIRLDQLSQGRRLDGQYIAHGADTLRIHTFGTQLAAAWTVREDPEDDVGSVVVATGATADELADPAHQTTLSPRGAPAQITGPDAGPLAVAWEDQLDVTQAATARALWLTPGAVPDAQTAASFFRLATPSTFDDAFLGFGQLAAVSNGAAVRLCPLPIEAPSSGQPFTNTTSIPCDAPVGPVRIARSS